MANKKPSAEQLIAWARTKDLKKLSAYLVSGSVHGKPGLPTAEVGRILKVLNKSLEAKERHELGLKLALREEYIARSIACHLVAATWPQGRAKVEQQMLALADDSDWIVRESAASMLAELFEIDFDEASKLFQKWVSQENDNVKRAIALAVKYDARSVRPERWKTYRALVEPLLKEPAEYIRKNLGPFAIGDGLLARFPQQTIDALRSWSRSENENVRWNVAMIFTAAHARAYAKEGLAILRQFEADDRPFVKRAVSSALRKLNAQKKR